MDEKNDDKLDVAQTSIHEHTPEIPGRNGGRLRPFTRETSVLAAQRRIAKYRRRAVEGMLRGVRGVSPDDVRTDGDAYTAIVEVQAEIAMTPDSPQATQAARFISRAIGADADQVPRFGRGDVQEVGAEITISLTPEAAAAVAVALAQWREKQARG